MKPSCSRQLNVHYKQVLLQVGIEGDWQELLPGGL